MHVCMCVWERVGVVENEGVPYTVGSKRRVRDEEDVCVYLALSTWVRSCDGCSVTSWSTGTECCERRASHVRSMTGELKIAVLRGQPLLFTHFTRHSCPNLSMTFAFAMHVHFNTHEPPLFHSRATKVGYITYTQTSPQARTHLHTYIYMDVENSNFLLTKSATGY